MHIIVTLIIIKKPPTYYLKKPPTKLEENSNYPRDASLFIFWWGRGSFVSMVRVELIVPLALQEKKIEVQEEGGRKSRIPQSSPKLVQICSCLLVSVRCTN